VKFRTFQRERREVSVFDLGAMLFWTATDEVTSFAILDRYVEADGTFIEMSDNYVFCSTPAQSGLSRCWCRTGETRLPGRGPAAYGRRSRHRYIGLADYKV